MNLKNEIKDAGISAAEYERLQQFADLLTEWNGKMNLVSKNSMAEVWPRHILDSAQLMSYLPPDMQHLVDIGSGAGFPAIVLAILLQNVEIVNNRVENTVFKAVDVITARAVAQLDVLCGYAAHIGNAKTKLLFLKGQKWAEEDTLAQEHWKYDLTIYPNKQCLDGVVMEIVNLRKKR